MQTASTNRLEIEVFLQPKQSMLWDLWDNQKHTRLGFGGARGGSKSGFGRRCMLLRRLKYPKTTGLVLRRTYPELYKSHIVKLFEGVSRDSPLVARIVERASIPKRFAAFLRFRGNRKGFERILLG